MILLSSFLAIFICLTIIQILRIYNIRNILLKTLFTKTLLSILGVILMASGIFMVKYNSSTIKYTYLLNIKQSNSGIYYELINTNHDTITVAYGKFDNYIIENTKY